MRQWCLSTGQTIKKNYEGDKVHTPVDCPPKDLALKLGHRYRWRGGQTREVPGTIPQAVQLSCSSVVFGFVVYYTKLVMWSFKA